ncbi:hypothetical protein [Flavobacterium lindanitolerans]|uniref:YD repeat-containing protein n=1 Tax=Flavobacterium lindanitolerans TaxID=428988 RepID=A0A497UWT3_9FLAO|nr:hypothetical protein [Flavobacterium lindanitolerans]PKW29237.1 YD repeat-containing protein [Flavobacterium lindanitolerans]RLJ35262.1 YD repeat-containing protein [Flavobacterium lindanitolerans]
MRKLLTIIFLATNLLVDAQVQPMTTEYGQGSIANTAASVFRFDNVPVNLSTGVPDISIPLLSLPTRSKDIGVNMEISYHPTSIAADGAVHDDIRQPGWSINRGGSIVRTIENAWYSYVSEETATETRYYSDRYQFNFMGHSGIFYLITDANNNLVPSLYSGKGETLKVTLDYEPSTFRVNSFTIYDSNNYKYVFDVVDRTLGYINPGSITKNVPKSFNLSAVYDSNGKKLLTFAYNELSTLERQTVAMREYSTINKLTSIQSEGLGKINFSHTFGASSANSVSATLDEITLTDLNSNILKRIDLRQWDKLTFRDAAQTKGDEYHFSYSDGTYGDYSTDYGIFGIDPYGYPTFIRSEQHEDLQVLVDYAVNPKFCTKGVLEKILLPTGGTVLYEYESNTYSYFKGSSISENSVPGGGHVEDPESYYTYYGGETTYPYNHIVEELYNGRISNHSFFTISGAPKEVCIFIREDPYFSELSNTWVTPSITIAGQQLPQTEKQFPFYRTYNPENFGYGRSYTLNPGTYTIQLGHISQSNIPMTATRVIHSIRRNPDLKKWKYGGGIRIKRIAHFDADVPADYFRKKDYYGYPEYTPVKETRYDYNLFDEPNRSSGNLVSSDRHNFRESYGHLEFVSYRNVTVTDSGNNGKSQYTFTTSADYPGMDLDYDGHISLSQDFRRGLLKNRKDYDRNNVLVKNTDYTYRFYDGTRWQNYYMDRTVVDRTAKVRTESETVTVYSTGSAPITQTTQYKYHRDANRSLESEETTNSAGEAIKSVYYYNTMGLPLNEYKFALLEKSEDYYNGSLVATKWTKHSNNWSGNTAWLPSELSYSKAGEQEIVEMRYNLYDEYGNLLQSEQPNGKKTSYIWGYNKTVLVAQIENMPYTAITASLITDIQTATDSGNETTVLQKLDLLRNSTILANAMPTTYTYKPLIGISTVTDPKGDRISYEYDSFGRTKAIRDRNGKLISETSYKLTNQN